jgi:hypothetical protein
VADAVQPPPAKTYEEWKAALPPEEKFWLVDSVSVNQMCRRAWEAGRASAARPGPQKMVNNSGETD